MKTTKRKTLIIGCGAVGRLLAQQLTEPAIAWVRTDASASILRQQGLQIIQYDLAHSVPFSIEADRAEIYYLVPPPKQGQQDQHLKHFLAALSGRPKRLLYLSTTGVYGDAQGQWVDENSPIKPTADRAWRRYHAEQLCRQWQQQSGAELVILRTASIYGPNKLPLKRLKARKPMVSTEQSPWTNRIHIEDLVQVLITAMRHAPDGALYNCSDGQPMKMRTYFEKVAAYAGLPPPPLADTEQLSAGMRSYLAESRRINNQRLLSDLPIQLKYPNLEQGLAACFQSHE